jgi:hypothetical protein
VAAELSESVNGNRDGNGRGNFDRAMDASGTEG